MAVIPIRFLPDPILRQKAKRVSRMDGSIHRLIDDMIETMHQASGVGLAANQIGVPLRVAVIGMPEEEELVLINPEIIKTTGERLINEACLSIPGYLAQVQRAETVSIKARDREGKKIRVRGEELLAQALQHEIDHLNGVLYIDHLSSMDELRPVEAAPAEPMPGEAALEEPAPDEAAQVEAAPDKAAPTEREPAE
jgi:peptide deformylase